MSPEHQIFQSIACHGRVNLGNFDDTLYRYLSVLVVDGSIEMTSTDDSVWVTLTDKGWSALYRLNSQHNFAAVN